MELLKPRQSSFDAVAARNGTVTCIYSMRSTVRRGKGSPQSENEKGWREKGKRGTKETRTQAGGHARKRLLDLRAIVIFRVVGSLRFARVVFLLGGGSGAPDFARAPLPPPSLPLPAHLSSVCSMQSGGTSTPPDRLGAGLGKSAADSSRDSVLAVAEFRYNGV